MISLVMTTYNGLKYISEQLDSIRTQTLLPDEVLIYDDRSTDGTYEYVQEYIDRYNLHTWNFHARSDPGESPNASGPHHRWGGPGRRGAGNAAGDEYGARWLALNRTCQQRKRHALKTGDNGSDGGRVAACGGPEPDRFSARSDGPCRADAGPEPEGTGDHGGDRL